jgi:hypothetical protein
MDSRNIEHTGSLRHDPNKADLTQACGGVLALLEIAVATTIVVGFFDAVSQPFGWTSAAQSFLCAGLALLLWRVDASRETVDSLTVAYATRESASLGPTRQES